MNAAELSNRVAWLGHSGLWLRGSLNIYFDPFNAPDSLPKADIIFLTHPHYDHCSIEDVESLSTSQTIVAGPRECVSKFRLNQLPMAPGERKRILGVEVQALPAYNQKKPYHPRDKGWLGFLAVIEGSRFYHAGDTDPIDEMNGLAPDVAFLPVDNLYSLGGGGAAAAAERLRPRLAVPIHYGTVCGGGQDAIRFLEECGKKGIAAAVMDRPAMAPFEAAPTVEPMLGP